MTDQFPTTGGEIKGRIICIQGEKPDDKKMRQVLPKIRVCHRNKALSQLM